MEKLGESIEKKFSRKFKKFYNKNKNKFKKFKNDTKYFKYNCFVCGKANHRVANYRHRKNKKKAEKNKVNMIKMKTVTAIVMEVNIINSVKNWVGDTGVIRHICIDMSAFASYTPIDNGNVVCIGDSRCLPVDGKWKVLLKITSGKVLALNDVLYVRDIRQNLVSGSLLGKMGIKLMFESNQLILTKNGVFLEK